MRAISLVSYLLLVILPWVSGCDSDSADRFDRALISTYLHVSIRPSLLNSSTGVLQLRNITDKPRALTIYFRNFDSNQTNSINENLDPNETVEIGALEGWCLEPNETFEITSPGYFSVIYDTYKAENGSIGFKNAWRAGRFIPATNQ
jgi:hypothetical protein